MNQPADIDRIAIQSVVAATDSILPRFKAMDHMDHGATFQPPGEPPRPLPAPPYQPPPCATRPDLPV